MSSIPEQDYLSQLHIIQSQNPPCLAVLADAKTIYDIDLGTRTINAPAFLSVSADHKAETIYFRVKRFHDYMDLSNTVCVIQYVTPDQKYHTYAVPFYDVVTEKTKENMIFPWCVDGAATEYKGEVKFSIRFYQVEECAGEYYLIYNLNTGIATSKVLEGMQVTELSKDFDLSAEGFDYLLSLIQNINRDGVYWDLLD